MRRRLAVLAAVLSIGAAGTVVAGAAIAGTAVKPVPAVPSAAAKAVVWRTPEVVPGITALNVGGEAGAGSVSCGSAGNCAAGGSYTDSHRHSQAFVASEVNGTWRSAKEVPGTAALNTGENAVTDSVSCASAGSCSASGLNGGDSFLVDESAGTWGTAHVVPPLARRSVGSETSLDSVSCVSTGACTAGGSFLDASLHNVAFVIDKLVPRSTRAVLSLSAAKVIHGHEQAERMSVTLSGSGAAPTGSVTIKAGKTVVCVLKLASGKGSCRTTATKLKAGTYHLTAAYGGNADFAPSVSAARTLTVLK